MAPPLDVVEEFRLETGKASRYIAAGLLDHHAIRGTLSTGMSCLIDMHTGEELVRYSDGTTQTVWAGTTLDTQSMHVTTGSAHHVSVFDVETGTMLSQMTPFSDFGRDVCALNGAGRESLVAAVSDDDTMAVCDVRTQQVVMQTQKLPSSQYICGVTALADGSALVAVGCGVLLYVDLRKPLQRDGNAHFVWLSTGTGAAKDWFFEAAPSLDGRRLFTCESSKGMYEVSLDAVLSCSPGDHMVATQRYTNVLPGARHSSSDYNTVLSHPHKDLVVLAGAKYSAAFTVESQASSAGDAGLFECAWMSERVQCCWRGATFSYLRDKLYTIDEHGVIASLRVPALSEWTPESHPYYPRAFRDTARAAVQCAFVQSTALSELPVELLQLVIEHLAKMPTTTR